MTTEQIDLDEALGELRTLLHEYGDLAKELLNHHNMKEGNHYLHELKARLDHLKYMLDESNDEAERKKHFLREHAEAVQHAINHMHHVRLLDAELHSVEAEEQYALIEELKSAYHKLEELYEKLQRRKELQEYFEHHAHVRPGATFYPLGSDNQE